MLTEWIRVGIVILVASAAILVAGLLMPLTIEHDVLGTVDCGTGLSINDEIERADERSLCEDAALSRRTLVYLISGFVGGSGLIVLAFDWPQRPGTGGPKHPLNRLA